MAGNLTTYLENALLAHSTGEASYTKPTNTYLALFTVAPTDSGGGTEVSGGNYARIQLSWGTPSGGEIANNSALRFPATGTATSPFGTIVALGIFDASTTGNLLWYGDLSATVTINTGDTYTITSGGITLTLD